MRTVRRLRLRCFTFYDSLCRAVHFGTTCPVETMASPSETYYGEIDLQVEVSAYQS